MKEFLETLGYSYIFLLITIGIPTSVLVTLEIINLNLAILIIFGLFSVLVALIHHDYI